MSDQPKVFISYSPLDKDIALEIDSLLRTYRVKTFVDFDRVIENELLLENVLQELGACQGVVLIWSQRAVNDEVVDADWQTALSFGKPVIPYILDNTPLPPKINSSQIIPIDNLQNAKDEILRSIYEGNPVPPPQEPVAIAMTPGHWRVEIDERSRTSVMELDLNPDRKITGQHNKLGLSGSINGEWQFDSTNDLLTLQVESRFGLRPNRYVLRIQLTSQDKEAIYGEDMYGFAGIQTYKLIKGS
jgi:hypothetical protein